MRKVRDIRERFWEKVDVSGDCWLWTAGLFSNGYGAFGLRPGGPQKKALAHRWAYEQMVGPVPDGMDLDHLCRNRKCANPAHLEPVTRSVNLSRSPLMDRNSDKTHCKRGHEFTAENTYLMPNDKGRLWRGCRQCRAEHMREQRAGVS